MIPSSSSRRPAIAGRSRDLARRRSALADLRLAPTRSGQRAERRAAWHYRLRGYRVVGRNVRAGGNELDLIVRRGRRLVFCEVKAKSGEGFGDPLEMVDAEKRRRVRRAAKAWLAAHREHAALDVGFEVVAVRGGRLSRLRDDLT